MRPRLPISVLLLARDEVAHLEALLPTLAFAAEVVMVWDPRGDDAVRRLGEQHGARVIARPFDGFGPQRAAALAACRERWVLWLDADERLDATAVASLAAAVESPRATSFAIDRRTWFLGRPVRFCGWQRERIVRLFQREPASFDDAAVHERVSVRGPAPARLAGRIEHHSYTTWAQCVDKPRHYAALAAERAWSAGRRAGVLDVAVRPPLRFLRQYIAQLGFLDGATGLVVSALGAWQVFLKYGALWARARTERW